MDIETLVKLQSVRVLVVGDVMLDRYWYGDTSRISPEAPVSVVNVDHTEERPGGAANVAFNVVALGGQAELAGFTGKDSNSDKLAGLLTANDIYCHFESVEQQPTITKLRIISHNQQLIRLDFEQTFHNTDTTALLKRFEQCLSRVDIVVLSDYGKGTLAQAQAFIQCAKDAGKPVLVDPKGKDFSLYQGATLVTPNQAEFEAIVGPCLSIEALITKGQKLLMTCQFEALLVTRGEQGMVLIQADQSPVILNAQAREVYDVTGAGDTVISVMALAIGAGIDLTNSAYLANVAAGLVVAKLGTAVVTYAELLLAIHDMGDDTQGIVTETQLMSLRANAKACGEKVVMTNGCFDILHEGHIQYLNEAKKLGARLIVAVNTDESVARLKGKHRPINSLQARMAVLAGLRSVDWVVPFAEQTPERLIQQISPDVLVKGGDYRVDEIAGSQAVQAKGGEVKILSFVKGCSTSKTIEQINQLTQSKPKETSL